MGSRFMVKRNPARTPSQTNSYFGESDFEQGVKLAQYQKTVNKLDVFYGCAKRQILKYQSPTTGLFPSTSDNDKEASLRHSIFCGAAVWSLYRAYRRIDDDRGKAYELGQSAVKCMRGILTCWLSQASRLEQFKSNQHQDVALHSKFHLATGEPIIECDKYGHLQIDIPSLYLLYLVQMVTTGLQIIYSVDEVNFIQNLVYYVERAYRTPDFGIWETGSKYNNGTPEVHASSIGMAKAALEAINGFNVLGETGSSWSVIYVDIDAHNRNRSIFETLLPRESSSKNTDAALLFTISYPCFATHDESLYKKTKSKILRKLKGEYGFKRFLRDGHGSVLEDPRKRFYEEGQLKTFDTIECEWPLFIMQMIIDGVYKGDKDQVTEYQNLLSSRVRRDKYDDVLIPKYYYVALDGVEIEKENPGSQLKLPSVEGNVPLKLFLWNQALYLISQLLVEELVTINDIDPIRRYLPSYSRPRRTGRYSFFQGTASDLVVQIALIAESMRLQAMMATYGIQTQTPREVEPIQLWPPGELARVYEHLGVNKKLKLSGRPPRPLGALSTSKLYRIAGHTIMCYPLILEISDFYLSHDLSLLVDDIKNELHFVRKYWRLSGRPTVCLLIREDNMRDVKFKELLDMLAKLKSGSIDNLQIRIGRVQNLISSSCIEHLDFLQLNSFEWDYKPFTLKEHVTFGYQSLTDIRKATVCFEDKPTYPPNYNKLPTNELVTLFKMQSSMIGQSVILGLILNKEGPGYKIDERTVKEFIEHINYEAGVQRCWNAVRYCSSLLHKLVDSISPYVTQILVNGKQVSIGVIGEEEYPIDSPLTPSELKNIIYSVIQKHDVYQSVLQQEIMLYMGKLISNNPGLFSGILKIRIGWIIHAIVLYCKYFYPDMEPLEDLSPSEIRTLVQEVLNVPHWSGLRSCTPFIRRQIEGALGRVPNDFYAKVWNIMLKTPGGIDIFGFFLPQQPTLSNMTMQELDFSLTIEAILNRITKPEKRQIVVELMAVISTILERNQELIFEEKVVIDNLIEDAFNLYAVDQVKKGIKIKSEMSEFYSIPPSTTSRYLARAVVNYILSGSGAYTDQDCRVS